MKYKIIHETEYVFSSEVFLEPHFLRFKPKITPHAELLSFQLHLSIPPTGFKELVDAENNLIHIYWFEGLHKTLSIKSESMVLVHEHNPFDFIIYPSDSFKLPVTYAESLKSLLQTALKVEEISKPLIEYGEKILRESDSNTIEFITNLTRKIHADFIVESRPEGFPFKADKTFRLKKASCRDLSWMQIQLLRQLGIATRFVSGYYYVSIDNPEFELHAWIEVYLPGAGWIGFDPSNGIMTGSSHIVISTSTISENTMPVTGSIRGSATSTLSSNLFIEPIE